MSVISNSDVYKIICKTLNTVDHQIMEHSQIVGYTLFKMLQYENTYSLEDLIDYTMVGILHDIGLYKTGTTKQLAYSEMNNVWEHSIYGYLFLRYLSPLADKAEIVLYHHLDYNKHSLIDNKHIKICQHLAFADKLDTYRRLHAPNMPTPRTYFSTQKNIEFSVRSQNLFNQADEVFHITENLQNGSYLAELDSLLRLRSFSESDVRNYLKMLIYTIDFRSEVTVLHTLGTTTFAMEIAKLMRLSAIETQQLYYGALLHDIGKIDIPLSILESPNRLTAYEMHIMRGHVDKTKRILEDIVDDDVLQIAIRHHEKLDGSGYPYGYTGESLTTTQRIVAVADILSALYQKRSYKEGFAPEKIAKIIQAEALDGKLCPRVVAYTIKYMDRIMKNFEAQREETMGLYINIKEQFVLIYDRFKGFEKQT